MRDTDLLYEMLRIGRQIKLSEEQEVAMYGIVVKAAVRKFQQNPLLLEELKKIKGHIYEATKSKRWGCGFTIAQHKLIKHGENPGSNEFGVVLENIRDTALAGLDIESCITNLKS